MGKLEKELHAEVRWTKIQRAVLKSIFAAGVLSVTLLAPNAMKIIKLFDGGKVRKRDPKYAVNEAVQRLKERGFVALEKTESGTFLRLTNKGEKILELFDEHNFQLKKPQKWDGKWRIIIFDIKEKRKGLREKVRLTLQRIGFVRLQDSVWVYPYDCEDIMILLKADFKVGKDILYVIADKIENDRAMRDIFGL